MFILNYLLKTYGDKDGWTKIKQPKIERLNSGIYFDYNNFSDLAEYASGKNFENELKEASHGLSCVITYRNLYQLQINRTARTILLLSQRCLSSVASQTRFTR